MNIYEFQTQGVKEWICANTLIEAFQFYNSLNGCEICDYSPINDDVILIPESEWEDYKIVDSKNIKENVSFKQFMENQKEVCMVATTLY